MEPSEWKDRFSRQVILPAIGEAGQKKWNEASVGIVGEGIALEAALTALITSGLTTLRVLAFDEFDLSAWKNRFPESNLSLAASPVDFQELSAQLILTEKEAPRREWSRFLRARPRPAFFGWNAGSGAGLFFSKYEAGGCPCFECFETLNPKAFNRGDSDARRFLGALAASEVLQWLLKGESPIENKVWITSLDAGLSVHHPVFPSAKCPAGLMDRGAKVTP
ncbi:MAG: hypothetical protein ACREL1_03125 [bacterium]